MAIRGAPQKIGEDRPRKSHGVRLPRARFVLSNQKRRQLGAHRSVQKLVTVDVAANLPGFELRWINCPPEFIDVIRRDGFRAVAERKRPRQIQSLRGATRGLIEVMLLLQKCLSRDVFEE